MKDQSKTKQAQSKSERIKVDQVLKESEERYRAILENIQEGYYEVDLAGNYTFFNSSMSKLIGYTEEEMIGMNYRLYMDEENAKKVFRDFNEVYRTGISSEVDYEQIRKDGSKMYVETSVALMRDSSGQPTGFRGIVRDVTEHRQMEEMLREREKRYRHMIENATDLIQSVDPEGRFIFVNSAWRESLGYTEEEISDLNLFQIIHPDSMAHCQGIFQKIMSGHSVKNTQATFISKSGRLLIVEGNIGPHMVGAKVVATHGFFRDITESKQVEEALRESENRYHSLFNYAVDGMALGNAETGELTDCNQALCSMVERDRTELIGQHQSILHPKNYLEKGLSPSFRLHKAGDKVQILEDRLVSKSGKIIPVEINATKIKIRGHEHLLGIFRDITDRKQAEDALRESEQRLHSIVDGSPIPAFVIGKDHRVIHWNKALEEMSRIESGEIVGTREHWKAFYNEERPCMADLLVDEDVELIPQWYPGKYVKSPLIEGAYEATDFFPALGEDGKWLRFTAAVIRDSKEMIVGAVETLEDITERKQAEEKIQQMAYHDSLTGLPNRKLFSDRLGIALIQAQRNKKEVGIAMLDLDNFKDVNDTLGHAVGDLLLKEAAGRLKTLLRKGDTVARIGGDEFVLILPDLKRAEDATQVARKIVDSFRKPFLIDTHILVVTTSIGIAVYPNDGIDEGTLLKNADIAMYQTKQAGRDRYQLYKKA